MSSGSALFGGNEPGPGTWQDARFVVLPIPMERTVSYGGGTERGPAAILEAACQLEFFDEELSRPYWQPGELHTAKPVELAEDPATCVDEIHRRALPTVRAGKFILGLGGEHTVTAGLVRAVTEVQGPVGVLLIDAHLDLRGEYGGTPWSHACVARRMHEDQQAKLSWVGVRSLCEEEHDYVREHDLDVVYGHEIDGNGRDGGWIARALAPLPDKVYLSIDIDGLDPSVVPGTGTPEPGGLSYQQAIELIQTVASARNIVGADLVEVAPIPGQQVSEFTAAKIIAKLVGAVRE